jgi:hypothetical protein
MPHNTRHRPLPRKPKITRPGKRKRVTLIAAFRCEVDGKPGVVMCADSRESSDDYHMPVVKLAVQDDASAHYQLAVGGSGDLGNLIDDFVESLGLAVLGWKAGLSEQAIRLKVKRLLIDFHNNEVKAEQVPDEQKQLQFAICVKDKHSPGIYLWRTNGPGLTTVRDFALVGIGEMFYKSYVERLYRTGISMHQAVLLGLHAIASAKETLSSVGGETRVIVVRDTGMKPLDPVWVHQHEDRVHIFNVALSKLILDCPDTSIPPDKYKEIVLKFADEAIEMHDHFMAQEAMLSIARALADPKHHHDAYPIFPLGMNVTLLTSDPVVKAKIQEMTKHTAERLKRRREREQVPPSDSEKSE